LCHRNVTEPGPAEGEESTTIAVINQTMLILCDFDGTITERDVTDLVWGAWIPPAERDRMVNEVVSGRWTMYQYIAHGYSFVSVAPDELLSQLNVQVQIRAGWRRFVGTTKASKAKLHIVSNGLDMYIRNFVPASIPVSCFSAQFDRFYRVRLPEGCDLSNGEEFKVNCVRQLIAESGNKRVVYVGDGRADFEPALLCHNIFAVRESRLALLCRAHSIAMVEFDSFDTVIDCLNSVGS
jgi:2,3-diketo-5-methylthio-1-phosphopentane phosphatase